MRSAYRLPWVDRLTASAWLLLPAVALMPVWLWCARRLQDRSDDPLGIVAVVALAVVVARDRARFRERPRPGWLVASALLAAAAVAGGGLLPALACGVLAVLALCAVLFALRAAAQPMLALSGLALLALPLLSSLEFFAGFPLRVLTAEASRVLLAAAGLEVARDGATLAVAGRLVMVDAPCSGVHMGWVAYFSACVAGAWWRVPDGPFLRRLPLVGATVLAGNIVRNTLLVVKEARLVHWPDWTHEAIGLAAFALVCTVVLWHVAGAARSAPAPIRATLAPRATEASVRTRAFAFVVFVAVTLWPWLRPAPVAATPLRPAIEWPRALDGQPLRPLALSAVEQDFADRFPGRIARFTDGRDVIVLREVTAPTRRLHPAADCYRGIGYTVGPPSLEYETRGGVARLARCFIAAKGGQRLRVCEHIVDARGRVFTDASAWYWAAITGHSTGPWKAITRASPQ